MDPDYNSPLIYWWDYCNLSICSRYFTQVRMNALRMMCRSYTPANKPVEVRSYSLFVCLCVCLCVCLSVRPSVCALCMMCRSYTPANKPVEVSLYSSVCLLLLKRKNALLNSSFFSECLNRWRATIYYWAMELLEWWSPTEIVFLKVGHDSCRVKNHKKFKLLFIHQNDFSHIVPLIAL